MQPAGCLPQGRGPSVKAHRPRKTASRRAGQAITSSGTTAATASPSAATATAAGGAQVLHTLLCHLDYASCLPAPQTMGAPPEPTVHERQRLQVHASSGRHPEWHCRRRRHRRRHRRCFRARSANLLSSHPSIQLAACSFRAPPTPCPTQIPGQAVSRGACRGDLSPPPAPPASGHTSWCATAAAPKHHTSSQLGGCPHVMGAPAEPTVQDRQHREVRAGIQNGWHRHPLPPPLPPAAADPADLPISHPPIRWAS